MLSKKTRHLALWVAIGTSFAARRAAGQSDPAADAGAPESPAAPPLVQPLNPVDPGLTPPPASGAPASAAIDPGASAAPADPGTAPPAQDNESFGASAKVDPPAREVTTRSMKAVELTRIPGTRGDALRAIEIMPGIGRPTPGPAFGLPIIRGAGAFDSQVYLDGMPVPMLYHFGGITSFINSRLLDRVDLYPGNFSARYGRKLGGVIDVRLREPAKDKFHGVADLNLIDSSVLAEGPIGSKISVAAAARRSYVDFYFSNVIPKDTFSVVAAPVYYDYQAMAHFQLGDKNRLRIMTYGSSDRLDLVFSNPLDADPAVRGNLSDGSQFHRGQIGLRTEYSRNVDQNIEVSFGTDRYDQRFGAIGTLNIKTFNIYGRAEWKARLSDSVRIIAGIDHLSDFYEGSYTGPAFAANPTDNAQDNPSTVGRVTNTFKGESLHQPALYLEAQIRPHEKLLLIPSIRGDYSTMIEAATVDPRFAMRFQLTDTTTLKAGVGHFSQAPTVPAMLPKLGNPNLGYQSAVHSSIGFEQQLNETSSLSFELFHKSLYGLIVDTPGGRQPLIENEGRGRAYGAELMVRVVPRGRFFGLLSYTLMRSERSEYGNSFHLFDLDQTHNLAAAGVYRLGKGWEIGATFRLVSGNPTTPVAGTTYRANTDTYSPRYGDLNSVRGPFFHRLDVRLEKKWTFTDWRLAAYLDIQNVYNQQNREGFTYNYDYSAKKDLPGLPILPSLGIRGEL